MVASAAPMMAWPVKLWPLHEREAYRLAQGGVIHQVLRLAGPITGGIDLVHCGDRDDSLQRRHPSLQGRGVGKFIRVRTASLGHDACSQEVSVQPLAIAFDKTCGFSAWHHGLREAQARA